jgi:hypothetical protein
MKAEIVFIRAAPAYGYFEVVAGGVVVATLTEAQMRAVQSQRGRDAFRRELALSKGQGSEKR